MLRCYEGQHCSRSCCLSGTCCQETSVHMNTFWTLWLALCLKVLSIYLAPKMKWITAHTHRHTPRHADKEKSHLGFLVKFQVAVKRNIIWTLEKAVLKRPDWFCYSVWNQAEHFSIPPNWFMNNLISLPANHGAASHEQANCSFLLVPPFYFTSTVDCSLHFQHNVWTKIAEEILPSAGAIHHQGCLAMKYRPGPTNNDSYLVC